VSVGTRFIASTEAKVDQAYKNAVINSSPEDIVMSSRVSGTPAAVINTPYVQKLGTELPWAMKALKENKYTKKYTVPLIHFLGMKTLEEAANKPSWKTVWSAGQSVGLIEKIQPCRQIFEEMVAEYLEVIHHMPGL
jgi:nitronate monooxygenase